MGIEEKIKKDWKGSIFTLIIIKKKKNTLRLMKVNWEEHPWQCEASATQSFPLNDGLAGNLIFSNISL